MKRPLSEMLGPEPKKAGRPPEEHRKAKVEADTELVRIKIEKLRGDLVPIAEKRKEARAVFTAVRQRLLAVPARCKTLGRQQATEVDAEIRAALLDISRWARS